MAVSTADPMLMKGSKNCIVNSHGLESASTTVTMMLDQTVRGCIVNGLEVIVSMQ